MKDLLRKIVIVIPVKILVEHIFIIFLKQKRFLAPRLATIHNLRFMYRFIEDLKNSIKEKNIINLEMNLRKLYKRV